MLFRVVMRFGAVMCLLLFAAALSGVMRVVTAQEEPETRIISTGGEETPLFHPADMNADWRLVMNETIAYLAGWQQGGNPIDYAIRAAYLWQNGEYYIFEDDGGGAPLCWALPKPVEGEGENRNVVFVLLDACREDRVDAFRNGVPVMPYLSSLPAVRFRNAYAPAPWTAASMISIFSSTHVDTHQEHIGACPFPETMETMGEYFKSAGFSTFGVQTNGNLTEDLGHARGYDQYVYNSNAPADVVTSTALSLVEEAASPFFLYVHYMEPHVPYTPPPVYQTLMGYPHPDLSPEEQAIAEDYIPYHLDYLRYYLGLQPELTYEPLSPLGCDAVRSLYDGEVRFADDQLNLLITGILEEYPDTIIVIAADHGEHFWEHNFLGHSLSLYQPLVHAPLFIKVPGYPQASTDTFVSVLDLMPTLAALLNTPVRSWWEGRDLFGARDPEGPVYACGKTRPPWLRDLEMVCAGGMKLMRESNTGRTELYDISSDPEELTNLADAQPDVVAAMTSLLLVHLLENARANGPDVVVSVSPEGPLVAGATVQLTGPEGMGHKWFKDGAPLKNIVSRIGGSNTRILTIQGLVPGDSGQYECIANDESLHLAVTYPYTLNVL